MKARCRIRTAGWLSAIAVAVVGLSGCDSNSNGASSRNHRVGDQHVTPVAVAKRVAGMRMAALAGDQKALHAHVDGLSKDILHDARIPDPARPMPREAARARIAQVTGVRSVTWIDHDNLLVLVAGAHYRDIAMVDRICDTLAPLGETLGVVVNLQDVTATTSAGADAVSRDCQLPEGQRAFLQRNRRIEALDPATRRAFEAQQQGAAAGRR